MFKITQNIRLILKIIGIETYDKNNICYFIPTNGLYESFKIIKYHFKYQLKILSCITAIDFPENYYGFQIVYELLSVKFNKQMGFKIVTNELTSVGSLKTIFLAASWWECEIWDMFGIFFVQHNNLTRLLTDYGFLGNPLKKDFPLTGFTEICYDSKQKGILVKKIELTQHFGVLNFGSPWKKRFVVNKKNEKTIRKR